MQLPTPTLGNRCMRSIAGHMLLVAALVVSVRHASAQGITRPRVRDSNVGYIDAAIPDWNVRFQFDSTNDNRSPTRSEFFWSGSPPLGRGLPRPERRVDYQDVTLQLEALLLPDTSAFVALPGRMLDPEVNPNTAGLADLNAGIKHAFIDTDELVASLQLRVFAPTGDVGRGLGTGHVSLEPGLLIYKPLGGGWTAEAELRDWIPVGGTDFAGNVLRYGVGVHYDQLALGDWQLIPVAEFVGWTALDGKVVVFDDAGAAQLTDAAGDTIVNAKLGTRVRLHESWDLYTGFGRPLTGDTWYESTLRAELRILF